jgi:hypothetical protein
MAERTPKSNELLVENAARAIMAVAEAEADLIRMDPSRFLTILREELEREGEALEEEESDELTAEREVRGSMARAAAMVRQLRMNPGDVLAILREDHKRGQHADFIDGCPLCEEEEDDG